MTPEQKPATFTFGELKLIASSFEIPGTVERVNIYGSGHINDTFAVETKYNGGIKKYILQRINTDVFRKPVLVMENIKLVLDKLHEKILQRGGHPERESLTLVSTGDGKHYTVNENGTWRIYFFIENARTYDFVKNDEHGRHIAFEAARAFGDFQKMLADLPGDSLHETIPFFHHTPKRFEQLLEAIDINYQNRKEKCRSEISFAIERKEICPVIINLIESGTIPVRPGHNDTKINNVLFDTSVKPEKAKVIIDLDTLMPGTSLYDFGDMVRTTTCPAAEDEKDLTKVTVDQTLYKRLEEGFLSAVGDILTEAEKEHLAFSGKLITYNQGLRFLADYLRGDTYYKTSYPDHNLIRTRTQFKMLEEMERVF
ncbi:phosphotransferase enzyme family protein [candidate division KSB1 bacterium]